MQAACLCTSLIRSADQTEELWQPQSTTEAERFVAAQQVEGHVARLSAHSRLKPEMFLGTYIGHLLQWSLVSISPECHVPLFLCHQSKCHLQTLLCLPMSLIVLSGLSDAMVTEGASGQACLRRRFSEEPSAALTFLHRCRRGG